MLTGARRWPALRCLVRQPAPVAARQSLAGAWQQWRLQSPAAPSRFVCRADEIRAPVTSSLGDSGDKPLTEEGNEAVAIKFDGWR
jgi:hypothetical protein